MARTVPARNSAMDGATARTTRPAAIATSAPLSTCESRKRADSPGPAKPIAAKQITGIVVTRPARPLEMCRPCSSSCSTGPMLVTAVRRLSPVSTIAIPIRASPRRGEAAAGACGGTGAVLVTQAWSSTRGCDPRPARSVPERRRRAFPVERAPSVRRRSGLGTVLRRGRTGAGRVVGDRARLGAGLGALGADRGQRAQQDLADVEDLHVVLGLAVLLLLVQRVAEHRDAERAGRGDDVGVELEGLLGALDVDLLADLLFHPHARAAGAAAEAAVLAAVHLLGGEALDGVEDLARRRVDLVVPAEEARVVVGDLAVDRGDRREPALLHQGAEQLGVVDDLVLAADLRVLAAQ